MFNLKIFDRKPRRTQTPVAPSLTSYERRALELPGAGVTLSPSLLSEMERDSMIQTALTIKKLAVLAAETKIVPSSDSSIARRNAEFIERAFERMEGSPRSILMHAMDSFVHGWSIQETTYRREANRIWLVATAPKNPQYFGLKLDAYGHLEGLTHQIPGEPERSLPRGRFAIHFNRAGYAKPKGQSDLEPAVRHWQSKRALTTAWRAHLERFASPTILGSFERGLPLEEQTAILEALRNLHDNTAIVFPKEIQVQTLHGRESDNNAFQDAIDFHNREIARSILGQTLTTDEGRRVGSLALGKVHLQVLLLQVDAIRRELADTLMTEQIIRPLIEMNFGPTEIPRFEFDRQPLEAFRSGLLSE